MFNWLFKKKSIIPQEHIDFQFETYQWFIQNSGPDYFFAHTQLILPTRDFFPTVVNSAEAMATQTMQTIKEQIGIVAWPSRLILQPEEIEPNINHNAIVQGIPQDPAGTFSITNGVALISYSSKITKDPVNLVATFAHELSHYLTYTYEQAPPDGWENWEYATDITATIIGYGIFMANTAFNFKTNSCGWQTSRFGYLSEYEHVYSLAIFLALKDYSPKDVKPYLKQYLYKSLKRAFKEVKASPQLQMLKELNTKKQH